MNPPVYGEDFLMSERIKLNRITKVFFHFCNTTAVITDEFWILSNPGYFFKLFIIGINTKVFFVIIVAIFIFHGRLLGMSVCNK